MDHHTNSPQQQSYGPNCPKKLTVPYGSWHKQSTTTIWWSNLNEKADCARWVIVQTAHNNSNGGMWRKKPTVPYGSSYKQSTTIIWGTILTQTRLTVAGRPKHHTINAQQYVRTIWTKKLTEPYESSYKESTTRFWWTILTQTVLTVAGRPSPMGHDTNSPQQQSDGPNWPKSWLCPKDHHTNSPQQGSNGPLWHKQGWLCQKDLRPMDHHTHSPQQQS